MRGRSMELLEKLVVIVHTYSFHLPQQCIDHYVNR